MAKIQFYVVHWDQIYSIVMMGHGKNILVYLLWEDVQGAQNKILDTVMRFKLMVCSPKDGNKVV